MVKWGKPQPSFNFFSLSFHIPINIVRRDASLLSPIISFPSILLYQQKFLLIYFNSLVD